MVLSFRQSYCELEVFSFGIGQIRQIAKMDAMDWHGRTRTNARFCRPFGTSIFTGCEPSVKTLGYFQLSLWDNGPGR